MTYTPEQYKFARKDAAMSHPITLKTLADIHQAELLREAEVWRAAEAARAGHAKISGRWLALVGTMFLLTATLVWLFA